DSTYIVDTFYAHLSKYCDPNSDPPVVPDLTRRSQALCIAVSELREESNIPFKRWVPLVHYGL
ncbi:hypothetical protein B0H13DRAFT_1653908, partial [Mycena leptocephala]